MAALRKELFMKKGIDSTIQLWKRNAVINNSDLARKKKLI
jgi:hypothetical protein